MFSVDGCASEIANISGGEGEPTQDGAIGSGHQPTQTNAGDRCGGGEQAASPDDDAMYNKIKGLLQTQANLCREGSLLGRFHVGHSLVLDKQRRVLQKQKWSKMATTRSDYTPDRITLVRDECCDVACSYTRYVSSMSVLFGLYFVWLYLPPRAPCCRAPF